MAIGLTEKGDTTPQISTMNNSKDGHQTNYKQINKNGPIEIGDLNPHTQSLSYRVMSEKRASQPPLIGDMENQLIGGENSGHKRNQLILQAVEHQHAKRNSIQVLMSNHSKENLQGEKPNALRTNAFGANNVGQRNIKRNTFDDPASQPSSASNVTPNMIYKQEVTVEGSTANIIQHNGEPISSENAEWIRKAIEASH